MGQKLRDDRIGALSGTTTISLAASYLTIGGQQYSTGVLSRLVSTDVSLAANTLYYIYAVVSSGVPALRISTNVNSVGPAGFSSWKLVGAFYSNGTPAFGTFVNIEGAPRFDTWLTYTPTISNLGGTFALSYALWRRIGSRLEYKGAFTMTSVGAGGSVVTVTLPFTMTDIFRPIGWFAYFDAPGNHFHGNGHLQENLANEISFYNTSQITSGSNRVLFGSDFNNGDLIRWDGCNRVTAFSDTALKDL